MNLKKVKLSRVLGKTVSCAEQLLTLQCKPAFQMPFCMTFINIYDILKKKVWNHNLAMYCLKGKDRVFFKIIFELWYFMPH